MNYTTVLAELKARLETLERERSDVTAAISTLERLVASAPDSDHAGGAPYATLSMPDAVEQCLRDLGAPQPKAKIKIALRAGGVTVQKDFGAKVYNALYRLKGDRFYQERDGRWGLREWQNGKKRSR